MATAIYLLNLSQSKIFICFIVTASIIELLTVPRLEQGSDVLESMFLVDAWLLSARFHFRPD